MAELLGRVKDLLRTLGPEATFDGLTLRLGEEGLTCSRNTYNVAKRELFGPQRQKPARQDWVLQMAVMADAAEKVGGIARARLILDQLEVAEGVLGC